MKNYSTHLNTDECFLCVYSCGKDAAWQPLDHGCSDASLPASGGDRHGGLHSVQEEQGHLQNWRLQNLQNALQGETVGLDYPASSPSPAFLYCLLCSSPSFSLSSLCSSVSTSSSSSSSLSTINISQLFSLQTVQTSMPHPIVSQKQNLQKDFNKDYITQFWLSGISHSRLIVLTCPFRSKKI